MDLFCSLLAPNWQTTGYEISKKVIVSLIFATTLLFYLAKSYEIVTQISFFVKMKYLFFLLGFYLLSLSCLPCSDSKVSNTDIGVTISAADKHQLNDHSSEVCTPFCICSCCAASVFYSHVSIVQVDKVLFPSKKYSLFLEENITDIHNSIWQPPQIAA